MWSLSKTLPATLKLVRISVCVFVTIPQAFPTCDYFPCLKMCKFAFSFLLLLVNFNSIFHSLTKRNEQICVLLSFWNSTFPVFLNPTSHSPSPPLRPTHFAQPIVNHMYELSGRICRFPQPHRLTCTFGHATRKASTRKYLFWLFYYLLCSIIHLLEMFSFIPK